VVVSALEYYNYITVIRDSKRWITNKYATALLIYNLVRKLNASDQSSQEQPLTIMGNKAILTYNHCGVKQTIQVPYDRKKVVKMGQITAYLKYEDESMLNITQQPGIPYLVKAKDLGAKSIVLTNLDTGMSYEYIDVEPMYGDEIME
jgi:hypothetical protein